MGFSISYWEDTTRESQLWMENACKRIGSGPPPLGLHLLMGDDASTKFSNQARNLAEDRVGVVQAILTKGH